MSQDQIERRIERMMDALDIEYRTTAMTDQTYVWRVKEIRRSVKQ